MSKAKPPTVRLAELASGTMGDFFVLLTERTRGARRDGKAFYTCRFRDQDRTVTCLIWLDGRWFENCENDWQEGRFYKIRAAYEEHKTYGPQIDIHDIRPVAEEDKADGFDPLAWVERSRRPSDEMYQELWTLAETHIEDVPLRRLTLTILERTKTQLKQARATQRHFYPFAGGLLEHLLSVTHACMHLADKYGTCYPDLEPPLNRDLVIAGAILHDIGRTAEFNDDVLNVQPTVPGRLFGHLFLGRDLVRDTARDLGDVNPELLQLLEHIIITHLNLPEWGSPRLTLIPECLIIHHADDLDAKMEMYVRCLTRDKDPGDFTARDPILGRQLLKRRSV
jgi:3'-5' exoribonuclease